MQAAAKHLVKGKRDALNFIMAVSFLRNLFYPGTNWLEFALTERFL